jgi:hypothetical protein
MAETETEARPFTFTCDGCERTAKSKSKMPPPGWKKMPTGFLCPKCVKGGFRVIAFPLTVSMVRSAPEGVEPTMQELWRACQKAWSMSTDLANAALTRLLTHPEEVRRHPGMDTLPPAPAVGLYAEWNAGRFDPSPRDAWAGAAKNASAIFRKVRTDYTGRRQGGNRRWRVLWCLDTAAATYQYAYPWPLPVQGLKLSWGANGPEASVGLPGGRWDLVLRIGRTGGRRSGRDAALFRDLVEGRAALGECQIRPRKRAERALLRREYEYSTSWEIVVSVVGRFPSRSKAEPGKTLVVKTGAEHLFSCQITGEEDAEPFLIHADDLRGVVYAHGRWLYRRSLDTKQEQRFPRRKLERWKRSAADRCAAHRRRLDDAMKQWAAVVANHALRRGCSTVLYDDSDRSYFRSFPWRALGAQVAAACKTRGLTPVGTPTPDEAEEAPKP